MKLSNPTLFCFVYRGQQADGTDGAQTPMRGCRSNHPLDDILPAPAEDMINDIGEESDYDGETCHPDPRSFLMTKTCFPKFEWKLQKWIIRQQRYLEVIRNRALGLFADHEQRVVVDEDMAWLREHYHIVNPPAAGSLANRNGTTSRPAANCCCEDSMHWLDGCSRVSVLGGYFSGTLEGGWMGDNLEFFGEVLGLFLVFCLFYHYIIHIHALRAVLSVHDVGINDCDVYFLEWHRGSDRTTCMAIM